MINSITVTKPNGEYLTIELRNPEQSGFFVRGIDGLGPPKAVINSGDSIYGDGGYYNSTRYSQRNVVLSLGFYETKTETIEQLRNKTYVYFPAKTQLTFTVVTDTKTAIFYGYVETNEPNIFSREEGTQISILCPDPFMYSEAYTQTIFSGLLGGFEFPWENPSTSQSLIQFSSIQISTQGNVFYSGDISTGVVIIIKFIGAVTDPVIYNVSTGESMPISSTRVTAITGSNFVANDVVVISTSRGSKFITLIRNGLQHNILSALGAFPDWFTINTGDNVFTYTAGAGVANMQFEIDYRLVYGGI